jgi:ribosomal protein S18 acetylase RimI-like enzyme
LIGGDQAASHEDELLALRAEACDAGAGDSARRLRVWRRQPGFVLAEARHGGYLVGYACGMPLRPSTSWWKELTTPLPEETVAEHPGRTFALTELVVRAAWRRQGIGRSLLNLILEGRPEERATLTVPPGATAAQQAFRRYGWNKAARTRGPDPGTPVLDVLVMALPVVRGLAARRIGREPRPVSLVRTKYTLVPCDGFAPGMARNWPIEWLAPARRCFASPAGRARRSSTSGIWAASAPAGR